MREKNGSEIIHDALNMLDDEMIEEVNRLRGGVVPDVTPVVVVENETQGNDVQSEVRPWRKWVAIAASISIVLLAGAFLNGSLGESAIPQAGDTNQMSDVNIPEMEGDMGYEDDRTGGIPENDNLEEAQVGDTIYGEEIETEVEGTEIEE